MITMHKKNTPLKTHIDDWAKLMRDIPHININLNLFSSGSVSLARASVGKILEKFLPALDSVKPLIVVEEAAKILGIETEVLDNHDGELMPTLENRKEFVRLIREWKADIVIGHRPNDYHPDHRYTSVLMQDAAYMVTVAFYAPNVRQLVKNPVFLYLVDNYKFLAQKYLFKIFLLLFVRKFPFYKSDFQIVPT